MGSSSNTWVRKAEITPVCTTNEAREYFKSKGLSYNDVYEAEILQLVMLLNIEIRKAVKARETSVESMYLSRRIVHKKKHGGSLMNCYLYMNSHYFTQRECISFNRDGFIGFAGWADQGNTNPILRAFLRWCDMVAEGKSDENKA